MTRIAFILGASLALAGSARAKDLSLALRGPNGDLAGFHCILEKNGLDVRIRVKSALLFRSNVVAVTLEAGDLVEELKAKLVSSDQKTLAMSTSINDVSGWLVALKTAKTMTWRIDATAFTFPVVAKAARKFSVTCAEQLGIVLG